VQLVITEVSQIQPYIFASNRMRENVGASYLVVQATEDWALEIVNKIALRNNVDPADNKNLIDHKHIEDPEAELDAEILYAGGGNFAVLFRYENYAKEFIRKLSRKILTHSPGLQLIAAQESFEWTESLYRKLSDTLKRLEEKKRAWIQSAPLLGLGVTVMCRSTGLPAVGFKSSIEPQIDDESDYPVSAGVVAKLLNVDAARRRLNGILPSPEGYKYPRELDHLGRSRGEYSHIAVVHIDGNDMGQRKKEIGEEYKDPSQNREYLKAMRAFSHGVKESAREALESVSRNLLKRIKRDGGDRVVLYRNNENGKKTKIPEVKLLPLNDGTFYLPILPIVYGGDDVTFVCDGRLGLSLAIEYIRAFEKQTASRPECRCKITACAGITIVKSHYPFAQAYKLTEELCISAKNYRRKNKIEGSCLDWHFAASGFLGNLANIREREYRVKRGWLTLRPVTLEENIKESYRAWPVIKKGIDKFREPAWVGRRNKLKALREVLRLGEDAVQQFLLKYGLDGLPEVDPSLDDWPVKGWHSGYCGYFDAIELVDWFIPVEEDEQ